MNYPVWVVPHLGSGWIIGIIAIIHVYLSHFAVGGGAFLAITEQLAFDRQDNRIYEYLRKHSRFFMILTSVSGAVTGVAIWWAIGLVNPDGTAILIQNFTLAWALEYLFFAAELATIFVYYYSWDKISQAAHLKLAKLYCFLSIMTLVIINGILTFMLTPGGWLKSHYWLDGFLNPTYFPSLIIRLLIMFGIAGIYAMVTSSRLKDEDLRVYMAKYCAKWLLPIFLLGPLVAFWYIANVPQATLANIFTGVQSSGVGNFSILARTLYLSLILSGTIVLFAYFGPYLNPKGFTFKISILFLICVYNYVYSNGIRKDDIARLTQDGFLNSGVWSKACSNLNDSDVSKGEVMFRYQCMSCHTTDGYRSMKKLLGERDEDAIGGFLTMLRETSPDKNQYLGIMPPLAARDSELKQLAAYLHTINNKQGAVVGQLPR
jgi:cytochrome bd ubiquinol oxidase subunit I